MKDMNFIKGLYEEGLVEQHLDEDALDRIRGRRVERLSKQRRAALYGYLVGLENAMRATKFVELAEQGRSVPSTLVEGYMPIIEMVEDIVNGGTAYIQQLKLLHKRAKNKS
jgi:hypothetical protein